MLKVCSPSPPCSLTFSLTPPQCSVVSNSELVTTGIKHARQKLWCAAASTLTSCQMFQNALEQISRIHRKHSPPILFGSKHNPPVKILRGVERPQIKWSLKDYQGEKAANSPQRKKEQRSLGSGPWLAEISHADCVGDSPKVKWAAGHQW